MRIYFWDEPNTPNADLARSLTKIGFEVIPLEVLAIMRGSPDLPPLKLPFIEGENGRRIGRDGIIRFINTCWHNG